MNKSILKFSVLLIIIFIIINNWIFKPGNILTWDVFGYYLYLPFKFIYNDLGLHNDAIIHSIIDKYNSTATFYQAMKLPEGNYVMKYSMGISFFYFPFFIIGHLFAVLLHYPADGFSLPYQYSIFIGGIIYSIIGIIFLSKILLHFFNEKISALVLIIIVFATNYIIHITMFGQNAMSHNYLFTAYSLILWLTILWHRSYKIKYAVLLAIICGISILSRPSEIVCLLIPLIWGIKNKNSLMDKLNLFIKQWKQLIVFILIILSIGSIQLIYWKLQTGKFLFNSYGGNIGEGFEFFHPYIIEVLFSFRKGWFIYTPIMFFALLGFIVTYQRNKAIFYAILIFFILNIYIVSSWSCWWYAQSFSQRSVIQMYPVMAILLGYLLVWLFEQKRVIKYFGFLIIFVCIFLNLFQSFQYKSGIIDGDRMTKDFYFRIFGKTVVYEADKKFLLINRSFNGKEIFLNENEYSSRIIEQNNFESGLKYDSIVSYSGIYSCKLDSLNIFSTSIEIPYSEITIKDHAWIRASVNIYSKFDFHSNPFSLIVQFNHNDFAYKYRAYDSENMNLNLNEWNKISFDYLTPEVRNKADRLKVYVWYRGYKVLNVDNLKVEAFEKK